MSKLNDEIRELQIAELTGDELDAVAGGDLPSDPGGGGGGHGTGSGGELLAPVIARVVLAHR
jgi:hypothetical protein